MPRAKPALPILEDEQVSELIGYAKAHGRRWKSDLSDDWMKAKAPAALQRLRNTHGPRWLIKLKLEG